MGSFRVLGFQDGSALFSTSSKKQNQTQLQLMFGVHFYNVDKVHGNFET